MKEHGNTRHGHAKRSQRSRTWLTWSAMIRRCIYPSQDNYPLYGGRGIKVCDRWMVYENFLADMGEQPDRSSIDRVDSDGNYEPGNCRWAPYLAQMRNKRNNNQITFNGETMCLSAWAERVGLKARTLRARIYDHGMSVEAALTAPVHHTPARAGASRHK